MQQWKQKTLINKTQSEKWGYVYIIKFVSMINKTNKVLFNKLKTQKLIFKIHLGEVKFVFFFLVFKVAVNRKNKTGKMKKWHFKLKLGEWRVKILQIRGEWNFHVLKIATKIRAPVKAERETAWHSSNNVREHIIFVVIPRVITGTDEKISRFLDGQTGRLQLFSICKVNRSVENWDSPDFQAIFVKICTYLGTAKVKRNRNTEPPRTWNFSAGATVAPLATKFKICLCKFFWTNIELL